MTTYIAMRSGFIREGVQQTFTVDSAGLPPHVSADEALEAALGYYDEACEAYAAGMKRKAENLLWKASAATGAYGLSSAIDVHRLG